MRAGDRVAGIDRCLELGARDVADLVKSDALPVGAVLADTAHAQHEHDDQDRRDKKLD